MAIEMKVIGLDVAKNVFQVHGVDRRGETVLRRRLRRSQVAEFFRHQTPCVIGIEATQGAHYWARVLRGLGHEVRLVAPQFVKPYLKSQKNDPNDAEMILETGEADLIAFARGALEDPNWPIHAHHILDGGEYDLWPKQARERIRAKDKALGIRQVV